MKLLVALGSHLNSLPLSSINTAALPSQPPLPGTPNQVTLSALPSMVILWPTALSVLLKAAAGAPTFSLSTLLAELHAFDTPHQSAFSRIAARHSSTAMPPNNYADYRSRCSMASLLTRVATADIPDYAKRIPKIEPRIGHNTSMPFLPVSHCQSVTSILLWYTQAGISVLTHKLTDSAALACAYYIWEGNLRGELQEASLSSLYLLHSTSLTFVFQCDVERD